MKETLNQFIERHEGRRYKTYKCSANADTIGVGHNLINGLPAHIEAYYKANKKITDDMVDELLAHARQSGSVPSPYKAQKIFKEKHGRTLNPDTANMLVERAQQLLM